MKKLRSYSVGGQGSRGLGTAVTSKRNTNPRMLAKKPCVVVHSLRPNFLFESRAASHSASALASINSGARRDIAIHFNLVRL